jgi:hypothetical protein
MMTAEEIAKALGGKRCGTGFVCRCPAHQDRTPSLSIRDGDRTTLLVHCHAGCDPRDVLAALRALGLLDADPHHRDLRRDHHHRRHHGADHHDQVAKQIAKARWLWSQRVPATPDTPVAKYLRKRGYSGVIPPTIGYLPPRDQYPGAMIAAFGITRETEPGVIIAPAPVIGVHLTRITPDGEKAPNEDGKAKFMLGTCKGAPIIIAPPNDLLGMAITEGIEDALNAYQACGYGVWAAGSAGFMPALADVVPSYIETVTIFAHDDRGKPINSGRDGALALARGLHARKFEVLIEGLDHV